MKSKKPRKIKKNSTKSEQKGKSIKTERKSSKNAKKKTAKKGV